MKMQASTALAVAAALAWGTPAARAQITISLAVGSFTYQFADPVTGQPETTLTIPTVGNTAKVSVYLLQTGGTPANLLQQIGAEGLGVRLDYSNSVGIVQVPGGSTSIVNSSIAENPNFNFLQKGGSTSNPPSGPTANNTTTTLSNAQLTEALLGNPVAFPGSEDPIPADNSIRMLIGTFTLQGLANGVAQVAAVDPFQFGNQNLTGPNPPTAPPDGFHGEVSLDKYLAQYAANPVIPSLSVTVGSGSFSGSTWTGNASGSWNNSGNWAGGIPTSGSNTQLMFGSTANAAMTNDIPGTLTLNQMIFGAPAYTLTGNGLNFVTNGSGALPQIVTNSAASLGVALTLTNNLTVAGSGNLTLNGAVGGAGGLAMSGTGTLTLGNAANSFSGGVTLSAGTVAVGSLGALGTGALTFAGGTLLYSGPTATAAAPINLTTSGTFTVGSAAASLTIGGVTGPGGLIKLGPGTLVVSGTNSNIGSTSVSEGTLAVATGAGLGAGSVFVNPFGTLAGNGTISGNTQVAGTIAPGSGAAGALNFTAPMAWKAGGAYAFNYSAVTGLNPGVNYSTIASSSTLDLSAVTHANPFIVAITSLNAPPTTAPVTYTLGTFTNGGSNGGITGFDAANFKFKGSYTGNPSVSLDATHDQLLLTLTPTVGNSPAWTGTASGSWSNSGNWSGGVPVNSAETQLAFGATANAAMTNDITGTLTLNQMTFSSASPAYTLAGNGLNFVTNGSGAPPQIVNNSANGVTFGVAMTLANNLTVSGSGNVTLNGVIGGSGGLALAGSGNLTLTNSSNSFAGGVTISGGTLAASSLGALGTGPWTLDGGTLSYSGSTAASASNVTVTANGGTITIGAGTLTVNGSVGGPGGLTKTGAGTLVLAGSGSYGGATNIAAGTLVVASGVTLGPGSVTVGASGTLSGTGTVSGNTAIAGTIAPGAAAAGALNFTAPMVWNTGGKYVFSYSATTGLNPGVNYSTISSSSTLDLSSITSANPFTVDIVPMGGQPPGTPVTYTLGTFSNGGSNGGITGFNAANFAFAGSFTGTPAVSVDATQDQLLLTFTPIAITSFTWTGSGNGNWSNSANWSVGVPSSNANAQLAFGATANAAMTNDITGTLTLNQMTFSSASPAYTLAGNGLNFATNGSGALPQIVNNSANPVTIGTPLTLTNNLTVTGTGNTALTGPIGGTGGLTLTGAGTLSLSGSNSYSGGTTILNGTVFVPADAALGTGPVTISALGTLSYTANTATNKTFNLGGGTLAVSGGATLTLNGGTLTGGYLGGAGTFSSNSATGARFANISSTESVTIASNSPSDRFVNFTNRGTLNIAANIVNAVGGTVTFGTFNNQGGGNVTIGANSQINASNFESYGVLTLTPGTSGNFTQLTNTGGSNLFFNGGSRTFLSLPSHANPNQFDAGIDLHGQNAVVAGGLFVNNGYVVDLVGAGTKTVIADFGSLVKGSGFYQNSVQTVNGGKFQSGNSPGSASFGSFTFGPGGVSNYVFAIDDATGVAGPSPDANGHVSGWGLVRTVAHASGSDYPGNFAWTADPAQPLSVHLDTLVNPTTVGTDVAGPMADFDPSKAYSWLAASWAGNYSGPTDHTALDAATAFDTSGFLNPFAGTFGWSLDPAGRMLSLTYTPSAVPEPASLVLVAAVAVGLVRRRSGKDGRPAV